MNFHIPGISLFEFIIKIDYMLYSFIATKKSLRNNREYNSYDSELEKGYCYVVLVILIPAMNFCLCVPFLIYNIFFKINCNYFNSIYILSFEVYQGFINS